MTEFISKTKVEKYCKKCIYCENKISQKGNEYKYCNNYCLPCFSAIPACKKQKIDDKNEEYYKMEQAIDNMENGICECENMFEPDSINNIDNREIDLSYYD